VQCCFNTVNVTLFTQIEQKEIETLELDLKEKVVSLSKLKKELEEEQVGI